MDQKLHKKSDIEKLRLRLITSCDNKDGKATKEAIRKVIAYNTKGVDVSSLFLPVLMASATNDIVQKKLVYLFISDCAFTNPEQALHTVNTLSGDAKDLNPLIRGLALRTMYNMRLPDILEYIKEPLLTALDDRSTYVRRIAVLAALKLFKSSPKDFKELKLAEKLKSMLYDYDAQISICALCSLDEVLKDDGGLPFDTNMVSYFLIQRLSDMNEWSQCSLLEKLARYEPENQDEALEYLNILDEKLKHSNKAVVMATINLFLKFTKNMDDIKSDVYERIRVPMLTILQTSTSELQLAILHHISVLSQLKPDLFTKDYKNFYLNFNEPMYLQFKKLDMLAQVLTKANFQNIIIELKEYIHHGQQQLSSYCLQLLSKIAQINEFTVKVTVQTLIEVLQLKVGNLSSSVVSVFQELFLQYDFIAHNILPEIEECWPDVQDDVSGKAALIWIFGEYGEFIDRAPYYLEELMENVASENSDVIKMALLTASIKLFLKRPPECEQMIGNLFRFFLENEKNMCLKDKALFYFRLLQHTDEAKNVVLKKIEYNKNPTQSNQQLLDYSNFRVQEFNTLSIMYDQPSSSLFEIRHKIDNEQVGDTESLAQMKSEDKVVVDTILDINDEKDEEVVCESDELKLDVNFALEKAQYQMLWSKASFRENIEEKIARDIDLSESINLVRGIGLKLIATSQPHEPIIRLLMYTRTIVDEVVILVELIIQRNIEKILLHSRSNDRETLHSFHEYLKTKLIENLFISIEN